MLMTPDTRLGPYELPAALDAGGMGEVYLARDMRLDRPAAIKVLRADLSGDADLSTGHRPDGHGRRTAGS